MTSMKPGVGDDPFAGEDDEEDVQEESAVLGETVPHEQVGEVVVEDDDDLGRVSLLADLLEDIEEGREHGNVTVHDSTLKALVIAVSRDDVLCAEVARDLGIALERDVDPEDLDRQTIIRLFTLVGLQDAAPDLFEDLGDARAELAKRSL